MVSHIVVVGFHHKLGCQVEFSYPNLSGGGAESGRNECPPGWKYLPTLALPDGSHNFSEDTVYFNLPSLVEPSETVFGVSCYRQIPVEMLKNRTADVTRSSVQKSVCILARLPIYGYIEVKLALIADAFFEQGDFSSTDLLVKAYQQLNACLSDMECPRPLPHFYVGLPLREIVLNWKHKTLILFKLFLLQKRVICFASPVRPMCHLIISISSLMPRLLVRGFQEVACVRTSRPLSPMPDFQESIERETQEAEKALAKMIETPSDIASDSPPQEAEEVDQAEIQSTFEVVEDDGDASSSEESTQQSHSNSVRSERSNSLTLEASVDNLISNLATFCAINPDEYRQPLSIFASGNLCLPYLSLPFMDLLSDISVQSYIIGTSNVLFQQKRQLADVLIDVDNMNLDIHDVDLKRQLSLSTEDLRFMDYILKNVQSPKEDAEGSELWIRDQFQGYLLALLRSCVVSDAGGSSKESDHFNANFVQHFKRTQCYQEWYDVRPNEAFFALLPAGHPFAAGTLSVADVKLKIAQTMQNSESGRKINQAVNSVGGAISQAKGAFSNWWSTITTTPSQTGAAIADAQQQQQQEPQQAEEPQEISVSFQNNEDNSNADANSIKFKHDAKGSKFQEDFGENKNLENSSNGCSPSNRSSSNIPPAAPPQGIVEIGKEAELLDKSSREAALKLSECSATKQHRGEGDVAVDAANNLMLETSSDNNDDIFIV